MKDILEEIGHDIDVASNGIEAVDKTKKKNYDIVFMDIRMPGMTGIEAYNKMKKNKRDINVVFVTAYMDINMETKIHDEGREFLCKPVDMKKLTVMINATPRDRSFLDLKDYAKYSLD